MVALGEVPGWASTAFLGKHPRQLGGERSQAPSSDHRL